MADKQKILIVDDDLNIAQLIKLLLEKEGYDVITCGRGDEALSLFQTKAPDLLLLDIMLPGMDGWQVCRAVRQQSSVPIIMLSAKDETFDKVLGLELGADDYITKPFDNKELVARVKAVLRRSAATESEPNTISWPGLTVSLNTYEVQYRGKQLDMPPKELELLYFLASHKNRVFTREQLLEQVWGFEFFGDSRTVDQHIKRLREKMTGSEELGWQIKTVWGVGYKFEVQ
ncbi:MAG: response regulator transcription factor [Clostridia bacterium]|nr:response regulator transcription factor [Clostridia bacterium]